LRILLLAGLYFLLARIALTYATVLGNVTILWPASGVALVALLTYGYRLWPGVFIGAFAAGIMVDDPIWLATAIATGNTLEPMAGVWLLRRAHCDLALKRLPDYYSLVLRGALIAPVISAVIGPGALWMAGYIQTPLTPSAVLQWWMADSLGVIVVTHAMLIWRHLPQSDRYSDRIWEGAVLAALAAYFGQVVFAGLDATFITRATPQVFWLAPLYVWTALRFGRHGMTLLLLMYFVQSFAGVEAGRGLFGSDLAQTHLHMFWYFHLVLNVSSMTLAIVLSERRDFTKQIQDHKALLRSVIDAIPDFVFLKDNEGRIQFANKAFNQRLGLGDSDVTGLTASDLLSPETASAMEKQDQEAMQQGRVTYQQCWLEFRDGSRELRDVRKVPLQGSAHIINGVVCISRDITSQKAAEQQQELLYQAVTASLNEIYMFDADSLKFHFVNAGALNNLGFSLDEIKQLTPLDLKPFFTPDDFRHLLTPLFMHEKSVQVFETMHRRKDGSLYPVEVHLQLFERGTERSFLAIIQNITQRLQGEQAMRLAASVFEHSKQAILITDAKVRIVAVNRMFTEITGFSAEEAIGQNPRLLSSGTHDKLFYQELWASVISNGNWSGEIWNRRKDGSLYVEWIDIVTVRNPAREATNYIGLSYDITERKAVEENIRYLAQHDFLTELPNRMLFRDRFEQALASARRNQTSFAVFYLDLNRFKEVNDTFGHKFGDELLKRVAVRLMDNMRATDTICRLGGDEFVILVPEIESADHARLLSEKLEEAFRQPCSVDGREVVIGFSFGFAVYPQHGDSMEHLLEVADEFMYRQKAARQIERM
jgi:diguanylate cyclase (GGDEF)-like protein/PAS domain S-box-containing protein